MEGSFNQKRAYPLPSISLLYHISCISDVLRSARKIGFDKKTPHDLSIKGMANIHTTLRIKKLLLEFLKRIAFIRKLRTRIHNVFEYVIKLFFIFWFERL